MSSIRHEGVIGESLNPEEFLRVFQTTPGCLPLVGGVVGARGETEVVNVGNYFAPMPDLIDIPKHLEHLRASIEAPSIDLPLEISDKFKYAFDHADPWFRVGSGAFLHFPDSRIPVRLVSIEYNNGSHLHWVYYDESEVDS